MGIVDGLRQEDGRKQEDISVIENAARLPLDSRQLPRNPASRQSNTIKMVQTTSHTEAAVQYADAPSIVFSDFDGAAIETRGSAIPS